MKRFYIKTIAAAMSVLLTFSGMPAAFASDDPPSADAEAGEQEVTKYSIDGAGEITDAQSRVLGPATTFYRYSCKNGNIAQTVYTVKTNPLLGGFVRGVKLGDGFGSRGKISSSLEVDTETDEKLLAAVNCDFFSMSTGVPMGVYIDGGRFVSSSDKRYSIGFDESGNAFLGKVEDSISFTRGDEIFAISYLNKYPTVYGVYLLTGDFGATTLHSVKSNEYIIALSGDITFGNAVQGEITAIREGGKKEEIPEGCAVLVVPELYSYRSLYDSLAVGDMIQITASANEQFASAINAVGGGDIILSDGEITDTLTDESIETSRNPRTAMGITADGELILTVIDGRQPSYSSGVTATALAQIMRSLGCVNAINLDGGGSSVMVLFDSGYAQVVSSPSDKTERAVPNALTMYESRELTADRHYLSPQPIDTLLFGGSVYTLDIAVKNAFGETVEHAFSEENTTVALDERIGSISFDSGKVLFTAGSADGIGMLHIETVFGEETLSADVFVNVTNEIDSLVVDQSVILSDFGSEAELNVGASLGGKEVYYGDMLSAVSDNELLMTAFDGQTVYVFVNTWGMDGEVDIGSVIGNVALSLGGCEVVVPVYFDDALSLTLDGFLSDSLTVKNEGYTLIYDEKGGVTGKGAFIVKSPDKPEESVISDMGTVQDTTDPPDVTIAPDEPALEPTTVPSESTAAPEKTTAFEETAALDSTVYIEDTVFPEETAVPEETAFSEKVTVPEETAEPEPVIDPIEPFNVEINSGKLVSKGLSGRTLWLWADGLAAGSEPYAVFELISDDGSVSEHKVFYEAYYDLAAYNGRALLKLGVGIGEGRIRLKTLLGYTAFDENQHISLGTLRIGEEHETNLYYDTDGHWSEYYVNSLSYMGIVGGSEDLKGRLVYIPDDGLSREQFAKILVNYLKIDIAEYEDFVLDFADNDEIAAWAVPYVKAAVGAGLMRGRTTVYDTVIFAPRDGIRRQEAIYVLGGLVSDAEPAELTFTDSDMIAPWAAENMQFALGAGLISGYDDGSIRPEGGITRGEAATLVVRLYGFSSKS